MITERLISRFLSWPLPKTVCADPCAINFGQEGRTGTNILGYAEAKEMLEYMAPSILEEGVQRLKLDKDEVLIVRLPSNISNEECSIENDRIRHSLAQAGIHNPTLVIRAEITLDVAPPEEIA